MTREHPPHVKADVGSSKLGSLSGSLFIRVPYYVGDLNRDPSLDNYPSSNTLQRSREADGLGRKDNKQTALGRKIQARWHGLS